MIIKENRTSSYVGTVNLKDPNDQEWINTVRQAVKDINAYFKSQGSSTRKYVKLQGRGYRQGKWQYNQSLPLTFAESADIYVYDR